MVISSSPARSNDQSLVVAIRSTTSSGLPRDCSEKSIRDMPGSTAARLWDAHAICTHATPLFLRRGPGGARLPLRGRITWRFEYKRLIPGDKVPLGPARVNDWWISAGRARLLHSF